jgi:hypothetical protein
VHGARGNSPDQLAIATQRETYVKQPPRVCVSGSMQPDLIKTIADIPYDQQRFVREDLLSFCLAHVMLFNAFAAVTFIPFKPFDLREVKSYTKQVRMTSKSSIENGGGPGVRLKKRQQKKKT